MGLGLRDRFVQSLLGENGYFIFQRTCYISCILKSGTTLTSIFLDENCANSRQCSFMTQGRYWTPIDPIATPRGVSRDPSKVNHAWDVTSPLCHFDQICAPVTCELKPTDSIIISSLAVAWFMWSYDSQNWRHRKWNETRMTFQVWWVIAMARHLKS